MHKQRNLSNAFFGWHCDTHLICLVMMWLWPIQGDAVSTLPCTFAPAGVQGLSYTPAAVHRVILKESDSLEY